jgi:hypothetical protein
MLFVQEGFCGNIFSSDSADPSNSVFAAVSHSRWRLDRRRIPQWVFRVAKLCRNGRIQGVQRKQPNYQGKRGTCINPSKKASAESKD